MERTPFIVVGGFLGAGKTTLLNHWLRESGGRRLGVLVNDFGALDIDGALLARGDHPTLALANGCVCCTIGDDLGAAIDRLMALQPAVDALVVETSGVADPWRVAQYALADARLVLEAVVLVVDTAGLAALDADPRLTDTLRRPLAHADLVLLNHADRCDAAALAAAERWAQAGAPGVPRLRVDHAALPVDTVCGAGLHTARGGWPQDAAHGAQFMHWSLQPEGRYDAARLRAWLRALPPAVLRLKGWLPATDGRWAELQFAGRHPSLRWRAEAPAGGARLVAIGLAGALPVSTLAHGLAACAENAASATPTASTASPP